jgi:hypothetical protein
MKTKKEWVKHLIKRFTRKELKKFVKKYIMCPCLAIDRWCAKCEHSYSIAGGIGACVESEEWGCNMTYDKRERVKRMIRRRLLLRS